MFSIPHLVIIFIVALAVLGPDKLPGMARTFGKVMADFRRVTGDFRYQIENEMREAERQANAKKETELNAQAEKTAWEATGNPPPEFPAAEPDDAAPPDAASSEATTETTIEVASEVTTGDPQKPADAHPRTS